MINKKIILLAIILFVIGLIAYYQYGASSIEEIGKSYIEGNVPSPEYFDNYLKRDLSQYFSKKFGESIKVEYELLRNEPTQTGVADPKYYAWVKINGGKINEQGVVRVAAIEKEYFVITDYLSSTEIKNNPNIVDSIFPEDVTQKIQEKLQYREIGNLK